MIKIPRYDARVEWSLNETEIYGRNNKLISDVRDIIKEYSDEVILNIGLNPTIIGLNPTIWSNVKVRSNYASL